jgi:hypothetical protein
VESQKKAVDKQSKKMAREKAMSLIEAGKQKGRAKEFRRARKWTRS